MHFEILQELIIVLALAALVLYICTRLKAPAIIGLLLTGIMAGPHSPLRLIHDTDAVEVLAELGVVLLLFSIGAEFSLSTLNRMKRLVLLGGSLQVFGTIVVVFILSSLMGLSVELSIFLGFVVCMSSTAIVLRLLQERAAIESPHGRASVGVLLFQDMVVVLFVLLTPALARGEGNLLATVAVTLVKSAVMLAVIAVLARTLIPFLLRHVALTRSRELFMLSMVVLCVAIPGITGRLGLSLGVGAFLAGMILSETDYSHQAMASIAPFRDVFSSLFFISIGMLLDLSQVAAEPHIILLITVVVLVVKVLIATFAALATGLSIRPAIIAGLTLCQIGEFAFILIALGFAEGLLDNTAQQRLIAVSVLSMGATPLLIRFAPAVADRLAALPGLRSLDRARENTVCEPHRSLENHLVIVGFGVIGRNMAQAARNSGIAYIVIEMNPSTVAAEREAGTPIIYGDAGMREVLEETHLTAARMLAIAVPDPAEARRITANARSINSGMHIVTRTRFATEVEPLTGLGADQVVAEEYESSIEMTRSMLIHFLTPRDRIEDFVRRLRADDYRAYRRDKDDELVPGQPAGGEPHPGKMPFELGTLRLALESEMVGRTLAEINLRRVHEVSLLAIHRANETIANPAGDTILHSGDILVLFGDELRIRQLERVCLGELGA